MATIVFLGITIGEILGALAPIAISFALNAIVGLVSRAFIKKPKTQPLGLDDRTLTVSNAIQPRQYIVGENRVGGTVTFINRSIDNTDVWVVIVLCGWQMQAIGDGYINSDQVAIGSDGSVDSTTYNGKINIFKYLGTDDQEADANLVAALPNKWTVDHKLSGCGYVVVQLVNFASNWNSQVPNFSFDTKGTNQIVDTRDGATKYTDNVALGLRFWLMHSTVGLGEISGAIDEGAAIAAANICDEIIDLDAPIACGYALPDQFTFTVNVANNQLITSYSDDDGTPVQVSSSGTLPSPLAAATTYYFFTFRSFGPGGVPITRKRLATTYANAIAHVAITITTTGSGTHTITPGGGRQELCPVAQTVTLNGTSNTLTVAAGGQLPVIPVVPGVRVRFTTTATLPAEIGTSGDVFYLTNPSSTTVCQIASTISDALAGTPLNFTGNGSGTITMTVDGISNQFQANNGSAIVTLAEASPMPTGTPITVSGSGIPEIANGDYFWIAAVKGSLNQGSLAASKADAEQGKGIILSGTNTAFFETTFNPIIELQSLVTGDIVQAESGGSLPTGLVANTDYYWVRRGRLAGYFAATLDDALNGIAIVITGGTGNQLVRKMRQRRYTMNGVFDGDQKREDVLKAMLSACGGIAAPLPKWTILPAAYRPPLIALSEDDIRSKGVIELTARNARRETYNTVTGIYVTPENFDQPASFPVQTDYDALAEDSGDVLPRDITLPFTNNKQMAVRLARIELKRARLQNTVSLPFNLAAYPLKVGATFCMSVDALDWDRKVFEVTGRTFKLDTGSEGNDTPLLPVIDIKARETNPGVFR